MFELTTTLLLLTTYNERQRYKLNNFSNSPEKGSIKQVEK